MPVLWIFCPANSPSILNKSKQPSPQHDCAFSPLMVYGHSCESGGHTSSSQPKYQLKVNLRWGACLWGKVKVIHFLIWGYQHTAFMPPKLSYCSKAMQFFNEVSRTAHGLQKLALLSKIFGALGPMKFERKQRINAKTLEFHAQWGFSVPPPRNRKIFKPSQATIGKLYKQLLKTRNNLSDLLTK